MRLLFFLLVVLVKGCVEKKNSELQGKWKIISLYQVVSKSKDSMYYDLDKDSIYIPSEDFREAAKDGQDSVETVNLFKSMYQSLKKVTITFVEDSVLVEYGTEKNVGRYKIKNKNKLEMDIAIINTEQKPITYIFLFRGALLNMIREEEPGYTTFIFKKE